MISSKIAKEVFEIMLEENKDPEEIVKEKGLIQVSDESEVEKIVLEVIKENQDLVKAYQEGKDRAIKTLMGMVMKASKR